MSKPTIASLNATIAQLNGVVANKATLIENLEATLKAQYEKEKGLQKKIDGLKETSDILQRLAVSQEEEIDSLKDQLEVEAANRTTVHSTTWKGLSKKQLDWLKEQGCSFSKTSMGFKLFLKGEALTCQTKIAQALKGKVCKDCNTTWIYFS